MCRKWKILESYITISEAEWWSCGWFFSLLLCSPMGPYIQMLLLYMVTCLFRLINIIAVEHNMLMYYSLVTTRRSVINLAVDPVGITLVANYYPIVQNINEFYNISWFFLYHWLLKSKLGISSNPINAHFPLKVKLCVDMWMHGSLVHTPLYK